MIQPCLSWGTHPVSWYKERIYKLPLDYNPYKKEEALKKTAEWGEGIPIGVIYRDDSPQKLFGDYFRSNVFDHKLTELGFPSLRVITEMVERFR